MARTSDISVCVENCNKLTISDTTGLYDVATNPGGWGGPNDDTGDVTAATLTATSPGGTVTVYDVLSELPTPSTNSFVIKEIESGVEDGMWKFVYKTVSNTDGTKYCTKSLFNTCSVRCCVDKMWASVADKVVTPLPGCGCEDGIMDAVMLSEGLLKSISISVASGDATTATALLARLQTICKLKKCNC